MLLAMLRQLDKRDDGYEIFEVTSLDDLDLELFLPMVDGAWKLDYVDDARLDFNEAVLRKMTRGGWWVAVLVCSTDGRPVGFELALERELQVRGSSLRAYYATMFSVSADHRRKGLGRSILEAINRLVFEEHGADLILSTFHERHAGSPVVQSTFDRISGWGVERFHTSPIWSRRLDKEPFASLERPPHFVRLEKTGVGPDAAFRASGGDPATAVPELQSVDDLLRSEFEVSFRLEASIAAQYLDLRNDASGTFLYDLGPGRQCMVSFNVLPMAINERRLRPIGQVQLLLAPGCSDDEIERALHHLGLYLTDRGCFAMTLVDMGMIPSSVLDSLGFLPSEDQITFAARGPRSTIAAFEGLRPPLYLDFT